MKSKATSKSKYIFILVLVAILVLLAFNSIESDAADSFSVSLSNPVWEYDEFTYSNVTVDTNSTSIKNISVYVENGSISSLPSGVDWHTDLDKDGTGLHKTAICSFPTGTSDTATVISLIKGIKFKLDSYTTQIKVNIVIDGNDTSLPAINGYTVTRGSDNHYYLFVPEIMDWNEAYNAAKSLQFMGMQGYLVTITSSDEDRLLDNITTLGAWAGATRVPLSLDNSTFNQNTVWSEFGDVDAQADLTQTAWKWVCGPESGTAIKITGSWSDVKNGVYDPGTGYSNWNRNTTDTESSDFRGNEPNNFGGDSGDSLGEYCMSVHYHDQGEAGAGILGWNDLPNHSANVHETYISGYFVEFNGLDISRPTTAGSQSEINYPDHQWVYTPQYDAGGNLVNIKVTCNEPTHSKCIYEDDALHSLTLKVDSADKAYNASVYDSANVKMQRNGETLSPSEMSTFNISLDGISYSGSALDGSAYGPSATPPKYAGNYTAKATFDCNGAKLTTVSDFKITKTALTITLDDQSVDIGQTISSTTSDIKTVTGLKGLDTITAIDLKADTSTAGSHNITENSSNVNYVTIKAGSEDVTYNYNITVVPGTVTVAYITPALQPGALASAITYGQKLSDSVITGTVKDPYSGTEITGIFSWDTPTTLPEVTDSNVTEYDVTFTPSDTDTYNAIPLRLKLTVNPKDISLADINRTISLNMNNIPSVELKDTQINNTVLTSSDYSVTYSKEGKKVKVTVTGKGNYTNSFSVYIDAHTWTGRIESDIVVDSSATGLSPSVSSVSQENGIKLLAEMLSNPQDSDETAAKAIFDEIRTTGNSPDGDYQALIQITVMDAEGTVTDDEKDLALSAIGDTNPVAALRIPSSAHIGLYFDISMDIEYKVVDKSVSPEVDLVNNTEDIYDISDAGISEGGFMETVRITVPEDLRPAEGYSRTYYIIRVHDDGSGNLSRDVLLLSRSGYNLTFQTDLFSVYALAYAETQDADPNPGKKPGKKPAKTDETSNSNSGSSSGNTQTDTKTSTSSSTGTTVSSGKGKTTVTENGSSTQVSSPRTGEPGYLYIGIILILTGCAMLGSNVLRRKDNL